MTSIVAVPISGVASPQLRAIADRMISATTMAIDRSIALNNEQWQVCLDKSVQTIESLEHRASRHAEHLARLESRVKALEGK